MKRQEKKYVWGSAVAAWVLAVLAVQALVPIQAMAARPFENLSDEQLIRGRKEHLDHVSFYNRLLGRTDLLVRVHRRLPEYASMSREEVANLVMNLAVSPEFHQRVRSEVLRDPMVRRMNAEEIDRRVRRQTARQLVNVARWIAWNDRRLRREVHNQMVYDARQAQPWTDEMIRRGFDPGYSEPVFPEDRALLPDSRSEEDEAPSAETTPTTQPPGAGQRGAEIWEGRLHEAWRGILATAHTQSRDTQMSNKTVQTSEPVLLGINHGRNTVTVDELRYTQEHHESGSNWQQDVRKRHSWTFEQGRLSGDRTASGRFRTHTWQSVKGEVVDDDWLDGGWRMKPAGEEIHLYAIPQGLEEGMADWPPLLVFKRRAERADAPSHTPTAQVPARSPVTSAEDTVSRPAAIPSQPPLRRVKAVEPSIATMSQQEKDNGLLGVVAELDEGRAKALTAGGADPMAAGPDGRSAMLKAMDHTTPGLGRSILGGVVDAESRRKGVALSPPDAEQRKAMDMISSAIDKESKAVDHRTYLAAATKGHGHVVVMLLDRGAIAADAVEPASGNGALHYAAGAERPEIVQLLLERGVDPSVKNKKGQTPRDVSPAGGRSAELLLAAETGRELLAAAQARREAKAAAKSELPAVDYPDALRPPRDDRTDGDESAPEPEDDTLVTGQYRLVVPAGWEASDLQVGRWKGKVVIAPSDGDDDTFRENVVILRDEPLPDGASAMSYLEASVPALKQSIKDFHEVARAKLLMGDRVVAQIDYLLAQPNGKGRNRAYFFACEGYGYVLTCSSRSEAFDAYAATFQRIAESFQPTVTSKE